MLHAFLVFDHVYLLEKNYIFAVFFLTVLYIQHNHCTQAVRLLRECMWIIQLILLAEHIVLHEANVMFSCFSQENVFESVVMKGKFSSPVRVVIEFAICAPSVLRYACFSCSYGRIL